MGKEAKIGVAVIGTLLIAFCGVLYKRVTKLKTTPVAVAKNESKPVEKPKLFGSPDKLTTKTAKDVPVAEEPPAMGSGPKWNARSSSNEPVAATPQTDEPAPPQATYPSTERENPATEDRYGSRYPRTPEPPVENNLPVAEETPPVNEVASDPVEESKPEETASPSTISNPFARSAPVEQAAEPESPEAPVSDDAAIGIVADDESAAPARLDEDAMPAAAITEAAPPARQNIYDQPKSRYIAPPEDEPVVKAPVERPRTTKTIVGGKYKVGPNENFWTVSEQVYGSGGYFKALHAYNAEKYPIADELTVGDEIAVPAKAELERQFPTLCPKVGRRPAAKSYAVQASAKLKVNGNTYVVQEGDTLFDIARYELGKAARWAELYELNRDVIGDDIDFLRPGMELVMPDDNGKADSITRQPGGTRR